MLYKLIFNITSVKARAYWIPNDRLEKCAKVSNKGLLFNK